MTWKELQKIGNDKADFLDRLPDIFMASVYAAQKKLFNELLAFMDGLDTEDGHILNNRANLNRVNMIDELFSAYQRVIIFSLLGKIIDGVDITVKKSTTYYKTMLQFNEDFVNAPVSLNKFVTKAAAGETTITSLAKTERMIMETINTRLGISSSGTLIQQGYLYNVYNNSNALNATRELMYKAVITEMPVTGFKEVLKEEVVGLVEALPNETDKVLKNGVLAKDYAVISNDIFAKVDRTVSTIIKNEYELRYFIYGGTIIKKTRPFCKEKCNKVYSTDEAKKWPDEIPGPIAIDKDTYDAVIDMGGINCRHSPLFITNELFEVLKSEGSDLIPS